MAEYETADYTIVWWAEALPQAAFAIGPGWPAPALDKAGNPFPAAITETGPYIVSEFLSRGMRNDKLTAGLDRLETELKLYARIRESVNRVTIFPSKSADWTFANLDDALNAVGATAAGAKRSAAAQVTHQLLSKTLLDNIKTKGFSLDAPVVPLGLLPNNVFYDPMMNRRHMKDVLVGQDHGEWTHLLQWYLVATASDLSRGSDAAQVFEYLGFQGVSQHMQNSAAGSGSQGENLWRVCCDRDAPYIHTNTVRATDTDDFRCPDMLHIGLAGFAPILGKDREAKMRQIGGGVLDAFTKTRDASVAKSTGLSGFGASAQARWPLLCVLLRRRVLKREPLFEQARGIADELKAEVRAKLEAGVASAGINAALSRLDLFFLKSFFKTPESGVYDMAWQHLALLPGHTWSTADQNIIRTVLNDIITEYGKFFFRRTPDAIPYGWSRLHRRNPSVPAPPTDPAQVLAEFRNLEPETQADLCLFAAGKTDASDARSYFRP